MQNSFYYATLELWVGQINNDQFLLYLPLPEPLMSTNFVLGIRVAVTSTPAMKLFSKEAPPPVLASFHLTLPP